MQCLYLALTLALGGPLIEPDPVVFNEPYYWPFNGPLSTRSLSEPFVGAAYDWYAQLPAPLEIPAQPLYLPTPAQEEQLTALENRRCYLAFGLIYPPGWFKLPTPRLPPSLPLVLVAPPGAAWNQESMVGTCDDLRITVSEPRTSSISRSSNKPTFKSEYPDLAEPDERRRLASVERLGQLKALEGIYPLLEIIEDDPCASIRLAAVGALAHIGSESALCTLRRAVQNDASPEVRNRAQFVVELLERASLPPIPTATVPIHQIYDHMGLANFN